MRKSLLEKIDDHDREQEEYIASLEKRVEELEEQIRVSTNESFANAQASSRSLLDAILNGVIVRPSAKEDKFNV